MVDYINEISVIYEYLFKQINSKKFTLTKLLEVVVPATSTNTREHFSIGCKTFLFSELILMFLIQKSINSPKIKIFEKNFERTATTDAKMSCEKMGYFAFMRMRIVKNRQINRWCTNVLPT